MKLRNMFCILIIICLLVSLGMPVCRADAYAGEQAELLKACTYRRDALLYPYQITVTELKQLFHDLYAAGALPWYITEEYRYSYDDNDIVDSFTPSTLYDGELDMAAYEERAAQILAECVLPGMEQWQIALALHDYLIAHTAYDESLEKNSSYDVLVNGSAVCVGYAMAYQDLLQRAGMECLLVTSTAMEHAWNLVCIDGNWYHVDLTWDDPSPDAVGYVSHEFFLRTDAEMSAGEDPHYDWDTDIVCTDTRFSNGFWQDVKSQICFESSDVCYLLRARDFTSHIFRRNITTGEEIQLYKEATNYIDIGQGNYMYEHAGLSLRGGRLWFNSLSRLLSMNLDGTDLRTEYMHSGSTYIHSSHVSDLEATLTLMTHDSTHSVHSVALTPTGSHVHSFTRTVRKATCTENGDTVSVCDCGLEARSAPTEALGHNYSPTKKQDASIFAEGSCSYLCVWCQDTYTETIPQITFTEFLSENKLFILIVLAVVSFTVRTISKKKKQGYEDC